MIRKQIERIPVGQLLLDVDNPRLKSKIPFEISKLSLNEQQLSLILMLIVYDDVETLFKDMLNNKDVACELLENDTVLVQNTDNDNDYGYYTVKEGNRRVCSLKLISYPKILNDITAKILGINIFDEYIVNKFNMIKSNLIKYIADEESINKDEYKNMFEPECKVYGYDEESTRILNFILRRMHIYQKKKWDPADKQFFEYKIIMEEIKNGAPSISTAINSALKFDDTGEVNNSKQKSEMKKMFEFSNFYQYVLERIDNGYIGENKEEIMIKFRKSPLPICETLSTRLSADYKIKLEYDIKTFNEEENRFIYTLTQKEGPIKIHNPSSFVDELIRFILTSKEKPIPHTDFKTPTVFIETFSNIINNYTISDNGQLETVSYDLWKGQESKDINTIVNHARKVLYMDEERNTFDVNLVGLWTIIINERKNCIINVKDWKNPRIIQNNSYCETNYIYGLNDLFKFLNSFDNEENIKPINSPIITPIEGADFNEKKLSILFRNPGVYKIYFEMMDKKTKLTCKHEFTLCVKDKTLPIPNPTELEKRKYIASYFEKKDLNIANDIIKFISEINDCIENPNIEMIFIASFRSLVELVCNDISKITGIKASSFELGPKYRAVMEYALKKDNFLTPIKKSRNEIYYKRLQSYHNQVLNDIRQASFIDFLNLSTHDTGRFTDKEMVLERRIFIEYLINFLDYLNDKSKEPVSS